MSNNAQTLSLQSLTYSRYRNLSKAIRSQSLARSLQYEAIRMLKLKGKVLDIGGGKSADYLSWLDCESYEAVNTDTKMKPTWLVSTTEEWPCPANNYDTVISFNTLEHIFDVKNTIKQMNRALKEGGELLITTPFMFPIHGSPDDFFRPTPSWYRHALSEAGFDQIEITPLGWGPFSTGLVCSGMPGPFKGFRRQTALLMDFLYGIIRQKKSPGTENPTFSRIPISLLVQAKKKSR